MKAGLLPAFFVSVALTGCAFNPPPGSAPGDYPGVAELVSTPFYPQERYQCGPAALLTVLEASGVDTSLDAMVRRVYLPGRQGSLQAELMAATRAEGRIPYRIDGTLAALTGELAAGRPVLVLQNLGVGWLPRWHYAVVIGVDTGRDEVVLRSGTERRRPTKLGTFLRTWQRSDYWAIVTLPPDELPVGVDRERWLQGIVALEQAGRDDLARKAWRRATERWPTAVVAWFGLGNLEFREGRWEEAERAYRRLLGDRPELAMVRNNLALALMQQRRYGDAETEARRALDAAGDDAALRAEIEATLDELRRVQPRSGRPSSTSR